jgi:hypothetical protein
MCVFATPLMCAHSWLDEEIASGDFVPRPVATCDAAAMCASMHALACMSGAERSIADSRLN